MECQFSEASDEKRHSVVEKAQRVTTRFRCAALFFNHGGAGLDGQAIERADTGNAARGTGHRYCDVKRCSGYE